MYKVGDKLINEVGLIGVVADVIDDDPWIDVYSGNGDLVGRWKIYKNERSQWSLWSSPSDKHCEHLPVDVGFTFTKLVCAKCDKEL